MNGLAFLGVLSADLAVDLGTANTLMLAKNRGIVLDEPSVVAINRRTGEVEAVGSEAAAMVGRTPVGLEVLKPMKNGVIADFNSAKSMLTSFINKAHARKWRVHPRIVIGVPSEITPVEKRAVLDSAYRTKAREVWLVDQAMMGALGAGLPVAEPRGSMIVDIGGGTTDVAVISLGGVVYARSIRSAGAAMDTAIVDYMKRKHNLLIGERSAENIKIAVGSAQPLNRRLETQVKGRDLLRGVPRAVVVTDAEIREALSAIVGNIIVAVRNALEHTPPELSWDIAERGMALTGGGAMLRGLVEKIQNEMNLPVAVAAEPLTSVVTGTGKVLNDIKLLKRVCVN